MSWSEKIELQVFDPRFIGRNLLDWFKINQKDALLWAGEDTTLPPVKDFFENTRIATNFPVCMVNRIQYNTPRGEDISQTEIALEFGVILVHGNQDWLAENAVKYALAFESMAANIPKTSFEKDSKIIFGAQEIQIETTFDYLRPRGNKFVQSFTTQVNWLCEFSNYPSE